MEQRVLRIPPVDVDTASTEVKSRLKAFGPGPYPNIVRTFAQTPAAMEAYAPWCLHIARGHENLTPRQREIVILRTGALCSCKYEFDHHAKVALEVGLTQVEIEALGEGEDAGWTEVERLLIKLCEEIVATQFVCDDTWNALLAQLPQSNAMYAVFTAAQYVQISILLNCFGVQADVE